MALSQNTPAENTPAEKLMAAIFGRQSWDHRFPLCYPYIIVKGEDGREKTLELAEAVQAALDTFPKTEGRDRGSKEKRNWTRYKRVIELRFGLVDGISKTLERVGQDMGGVTGERVRQIGAKALRLLRHPKHSRLLREFLVPSPEEIARDNEQFRQARKRIDRLVAILKGCGLEEKDFAGVKYENIPQTAQTLRETQEDQEALQAMRKRFPHNLFWNAIARAYIYRLSELRKLVENGKIRQVKQIGVKGEEFFRRILNIPSQDAV